ncbi:hypothetical protein F4679DRAFT_592307 [Xylaria curta]|nr:hypothetical protein F4679DRAFT_592307 [Xylaria curta]
MDSLVNITNSPLFIAVPGFQKILHVLSLYHNELKIGVIGSRCREAHLCADRKITASYGQHPRSLFAFHVFVSFVELVKYNGQVWLTNGAKQTTSQLGIVLCILQCWTSLYITSQHHLLPKAAMEATRATFHCMSLQRLIATGMAVYTATGSSLRYLGLATQPGWYEKMTAKKS